MNFLLRNLRALRTEKSAGPKTRALRWTEVRLLGGYAKIRAACVAIDRATGANRTKASAKESILVIGCPFVNECVVLVFDEEMQLMLSADASW